MSPMNNLQSSPSEAEAVFKVALSGELSILISPLVHERQFFIISNRSFIFVTMLSLWSILTVFMVPVAISGYNRSIPTIIKSSDRMTRIIDGRLTRISEIPYYVQVFERLSEEASDNKIKSVCGGSILTRRLVLTAAHCLHGPRKLEVAIGEDSLKDIERSESIYSVVKKIIHPRYDPGEPYSHDFGVIVLGKPLNTSRVPYRVYPVVLANDSYIGRQARVSGFGVLPEKSFLLRSVEIPIVENVQCQAAFDELSEIVHFPRLKLDDSMLCAGNFDDYKATAEGDSGGPLVVRENGQYVLVGISSWTQMTKPLQFPSKQTFTVFSNVSYGRNWIEKVIKEEDAR